MVPVTRLRPVQMVPPPDPPPQPSRADAAYIGVLTAIAAVLATRLLLLLAIILGFALAVMALHDGGYVAAGLVVAYGVLIFLPLVALEARKK